MMKNLMKSMPKPDKGMELRVTGGGRVRSGNMWRVTLDVVQEPIPGFGEPCEHCGSPIRKSLQPCSRIKGFCHASVDTEVPHGS